MTGRRNYKQEMPDSLLLIAAHCSPCVKDNVMIQQWRDSHLSLMKVQPSCLVNGDELTNMVILNIIVCVSTVAVNSCHVIIISCCQ